MATRMDARAMEFVPAGTAGAQKVAVLRAPGDIGIAFARVPTPAPDEVRVRVKWVGICGSDLEAYRGARSPEFLTTPTRLGHEVAGVVDAVGTDVMGLAVGDRVACRYVWGALAQFIVCRPFNLVRIPDRIDFAAASLLEVLPGILHTAELAYGPPGADAADVLIMGQGVSGLVLTQVMRLWSPRTLLVTDKKPRNLELARRFGATATVQVPGDGNSRTRDHLPPALSEGFTAVIPCRLEGDGMVDALDCVALGGRIVMYGCIGPCHQPFDFFKLHRRRACILSTEPRRDIDMRRLYHEGIRLVEDGLVDLGAIVTHRFPLDEVAAAFAARTSDDAIHVMVDCQ